MRHNPIPARALKVVYSIALSQRTVVLLIRRNGSCRNVARIPAIEIREVALDRAAPTSHSSTSAGSNRDCLTLADPKSYILCLPRQQGSIHFTVGLRKRRY